MSDFTDKLINLRYLSLISIVCSFIGSFLMFIIGALKTGLAFAVIFFDINQSGFFYIPIEISRDSATMVLLVEAVDNFLFGIVLMIFGFGLYALFIHNGKDEEDKKWISWLQIDNISQLKTMLAQVIIMILFVTFLEQVIMSEEHTLHISLLIIPVSILLLALGLKYMQIDH